jgi:hypothetical protein
MSIIRIMTFICLILLFSVEISYAQSTSTSGPRLRQRTMGPGGAPQAPDLQGTRHLPSNRCSLKCCCTDPITNQKYYLGESIPIACATVGSHPGSDPMTFYGPWEVCSSIVSTLPYINVDWTVENCQTVVVRE